MDNRELTKLGKFWQKKLRLQDWDITFHLSRYHELGHGVLGYTDPRPNLQAAHVRILDPRDYDPGIPQSYSLLDTLVHELLHLRFWDVTPDPESPQGRLFEVAIDHTARALTE